MVQLVCVTCGGPRRHAVQSQFSRDGLTWDDDITRKAFGDATPGLVPGFELSFSDGIIGEPLISRKRCEEFAGDVLDALQLTLEQRVVFGDCVAQARPANRRVLGCLLANLRGMRIACEKRGDVMVIEDNVRVQLTGGASRCASALRRAREEQIDLLYLGHLAHDDTMRLVSASDRDAAELASLPETLRGEKADGVNHELWGTYAYAASDRLYDAVCRAIREDFPVSLFRMTKKDCHVTPIDKLLQRVVAKNEGFKSRALCPPAFYRMPPVLPSKIHQKWDAPFLTSTTLQLGLYESSWADVWITPAEGVAVASAAEAKIVKQQAKKKKSHDHQSRKQPPQPRKEAVLDEDDEITEQRQPEGSSFFSCFGSGFWSAS